VDWLGMGGSGGTGQLVAATGVTVADGVAGVGDCCLATAAKGWNSQTAPPPTRASPTTLATTTMTRLDQFM